MLKYLLPLAASALACLQLVKDWGAHQTTKRRTAVLVLIVFMGLGAAYNTYQEDHKIEHRRKEDRDTIIALQRIVAGLEKAAATANQNQEANTRVFTAKFGELSKELNNIRTQVKTENLRNQVTTLQSELKKTQTALDPPKAILGFSFARLHERGEKLAHVELHVVNLTEASALDGQITILICQKCRFAAEPMDSERVGGQPETERTVTFQRMLPLTQNQIALDIKPPDDAADMSVGISYRCKTCIIPGPGDNIGTVRLIRNSSYLQSTFLQVSTLWHESHVILGP